MNRPALRGGRARSIALQALLVAALLAAVALVIAALVPGSGSRLSHAAAGWIAVAVILELIACTSYALLFQGAFSFGEYRIGRVRGAQIGVGELGAFVVAPTGAGGPAVRIWGLIRSGMPFAIVMRRSVIHGAVLNLPYILAAILLGLCVVLGVGSLHAPLAVALAPLALVLGALALTLAATQVARRARADRHPPRWRRIARDVVVAVPDGLRELAGRGWW
jgi:hypothetical protein